MTAIGFAAEPFVSLSLPDALEKATATDKVVLVEFTIDMLPAGEAMPTSIPLNDDIRKWIKSHAIAIKIDCKSEPEIVSRYFINAAPTIVIMRGDGTVLGRTLGVLPAEAFLEFAENALVEKPALDRAREIFESGDKDDPFNRHNYASALAADGKAKEALEHYLWCFDEGARHDAAYEQFRLTRLLGEIVAAAQQYRPAVDAMKSRRDRAESRLRDFLYGKPEEVDDRPREKGILGLIGRLTGVSEAPAIETQAAELAVLNSLFKRDSQSIEIYDKLKACDRKHADVARIAICRVIVRPLFKAGRYDDLVRDADPVGYVDTLMTEVETARALAEAANQANADPQLNRMRIESIRSACRAYLTCLAADRKDLADKVKNRLLAFESSLYVFEELLISAAGAKRYEVVLELGDEAQRRLDDDNARTIRHRVKANLKSPEGQAALEKYRRTARADEGQQE
ncbi:MAG: hypothetical protein KDA33_15085 [Phycisphaerales bacterium]|nr:hypothetical protein [Phycisphaerales bacterium]